MRKLILASLALFVIYNAIVDNSTQNKIAELEKEVKTYTQEDTSVVENSQVTEVKVTPKKESSTGGGSVEKDRSPEVIRYFNEVVMNTEFNGPRKTAYTWKTDMKIYVNGEKPEYLMSELKRIVDELNDIINPIDIKIVSSPAEANYTIYIGSHVDFKNKYKLLEPQRLEKNWGYFELYAHSGIMYVDTYRNGNEVTQKHLLREELTQSLGLLNDSWEYPESIFYQGWTYTTEYAPIDRELIDMLYNN
jgi:hypothetical protein